MKIKLFIFLFSVYSGILYSQSRLEDCKNELLKEIKNNKNNITVLYDIIKLWNINDYFDDSPFEKVVKNFKTSNKILDSYIDLYKYDKTKNFAGYPDNYYIIGPFDNKGKNGFNVSYAPEKEFSKDKYYDGKNQKVRFKTIKNYERKYINFKNYINPKRDSLGYALFFVKIKKSSIYQIRFSASNAFELFLDQKSILKSDNHDISYYDKHILKVFLKKGLHSILVKLDNKYENWGIHLRILNKKGKYTQNIKYVLKNKYPEKYPTIKIISKNNDILKELDKIKNKNSKYFVKRALIERYFIPFDLENKPYPYEKYYKKALKYAKNDQEKAFVYLNMYLYGSNDNDNINYLKKAVKYKNFISILEKIDFDINQNNLIEAGKLIKSAEKIDKYDYRLLLLKYDYYNKLNIDYTEQIIRLYKESKKQSKYFEFLINKLKFKDVKTLLKIYESNKDKKYFKEDDIITLLSYYKSLMMLDKYEKLLLKKLKSNKLSYDYQIKTLKHWFSLKKYNKILELYQKRKNLLEDSPEILKIIAQTYQLRNEREKSIKYYEKYLELVPENTKIKEYLSFIKHNKKELWAQKYINEVSRGDIDLNNYNHSKPLEKLYEHTIIKVNKNHSFNLYKKTAIAINNEESVKRFKYLPIYYLPNNETVYNSEVKLIKKSGETLEITDYTDKFYRSKTNGAFTNYSLRAYYIDNLEKGDIIVYSYYLKNANIYDDPFFAALYKLNSIMPTKRITFTFISEKELGFNLPVTQQKGKTYFFEFKNLKEIKSEPFNDGYTSNYKYLSVSTLKNWQELIDWYKGLLLKQNILPENIKKEIHKGTENLNTTEEKVKWIQKYLFTHTHYVGIELGLNAYKPFSATEVLERKYGDCKDKANLFNSLLAEIGINSNIVLLRTNSLGQIKTQNPPNPKYFNHAISYIPELNVFVDLTAEKNGLYDLPFSDQEATGIIIRNNEALIQLPSYVSHETITVKGIKKDKNLDAKIEFKFENSLASSLRYKFENKELRKNRIEKMLKNIFKNFKIKNYKIKNLNEINKPFILNIDTEIKDLFTKDKINSSFYIKNLITQEGLLDKREENYRRLKLSIKENIKITNISSNIEPKTQKTENPYLSYALSIEGKNGEIEIKNTLNYKKFTITTKEYPIYLKGIYKILDLIKRNTIYLKGDK